MVGEDNSLLGNLTPAMVLIVLSVIFDKITLHSKKAAKLIEGEPTLLIYQGTILEQNCSDETVSKEELLSELRRKGISSVNQVRFAILEAEGSVSIIEDKAPEAGPGEDTVTESVYAQARKAGFGDPVAKTDSDKEQKTQ